MINFTNTMNRRPFIKLLGANILGLPLIANPLGLFAAKAYAPSWLAQLLQEGQIESTASFGTLDLPQLPVEVQSGEFTISTDSVYFYQQRQYCFQIFEKVHPVVGQLEVMVPFWKKQKDGSWQKIATLNAFEMEALAKAAEKKYLFAKLLPENKTTYNSYSCQAGLLEFKTRIAGRKATTEIRITDQTQQSVSFSFTQTLPTF